MWGTRTLGSELHEVFAQFGYVGRGKRCGGKSLPREILLQVFLISAHLHSPSVLPAINKGGKNLCSLFFSFFKMAANKFVG